MALFTHIRTSTAVAAAAVMAVAGAVLAPSAGAEVPTVPEPVTYENYQAILDPGAGSADYFQPRWYDSDGRHIQAHGGQIVTATQLGVDPSDIVGGTKADGTPVFYWYGEDRSNDYYNSPGVSVYSSTDTFNWKNEGVAMRSVTSRDELTTPYFDALYDTVDDSDAPRDDVIDELFYHLNTDGTTGELTAIFERPKVLYNAADETWVMWWHSDGRIEGGGDGTYYRAMAGVAVSDSPTGPFTMTGTHRMYNRENYKACTPQAVPGQARDMTVFQDDDGSAYILYSSEENMSLYVAKLDEHYTQVGKTSTTDASGIQYSADGRYPHLFADGTDGAPVRGEDFQIVRECGLLESPAAFKFDGRYYIVTSGATGWSPNPNTYYSADSMMGPWIRGVIEDDENENVRWNQIPDGADGLLSVGDSRRSTFGSQSTDVFALNAAEGKFIYLGDRWNAGKADSTYVWLPLTIGEGGSIEMRNPAVEDPAKWGDGWDESYWDTHGAGPHIWVVTDERLPAEVASDADFDTVLPQTVAVAAGGDTQDVAVTWDTTALTTPGTRTIVGTLAAGDGFSAGRQFKRTIEVDGQGLYNIAPSSTPTASSRQNLVDTTIDGDLKGKGWDDWLASGQFPKRSTLTYTWATPRTIEAVQVHTYKDGTASWPSRIGVEYKDAAGDWVDSGKFATLVQDATAAAPTARIELPDLPATSAIRLVLTTEKNVWQAISEVEIFGYGTNYVACGDVTAPWSAVAGGTGTTSFCQGADGHFRISDNNGGAWVGQDSLSVVHRAQSVAVGQHIATTLTSVDPGGNLDPRAGLVLRNNLAADGKGSAAGYVVLASSPSGVFLQWDDNGNGFIDSEGAAVAVPSGSRQLKLEYTSASTATGYWRKDATLPWQEVGTATLRNSTAILDAGIFAAGNNRVGAAAATFHGTAIAGDGPTPTATPSVEPSETPTTNPTGEPTNTPTSAPTNTATSAPVSSSSAQPTIPAEPSMPIGDLYTAPGHHFVNGRHWFTTCEPYSATIRCRTDIISTQVNRVGDRYVSNTGWHFNNLTYLPQLTREQWAGNPLGHTGTFSSAGRQWRTECDTALTGRNGCRSWVSASVVVADQGAHGWSYRVETREVFNNRVLFRTN